MSCLIVNGSPRNKKSNSNVMCSWITKSDDDVIHLASKASVESYLNLIQKYEDIIVVYPLYVDAMPGIVKRFFEVLEENKSIIKGKEVLFIIHSGFSEAVHLRILERYHRILKEILELKRVDTIITPGSEGIRLMPDQMNKKRIILIEKATTLFKKGEEIDSSILSKLAGRETTSMFKRFIFRILKPLGLLDIYWNRQLKQNKIFYKRYDRPY